LLVTYSIAVLLGAGLLFLVQPMAARMLLPAFGGSPTVWTTCVVFFQSMLLAGYAYAHLLTSYLRPRLQVLFHAAVLLLPLIVLPIHIKTASPAEAVASPVAAVLGSLLVGLGLPFFALSATGPLLQRWFAATTHRMARDPYRLYVASNIGSLVGLIAYPFLLEPTLRSSLQSRLWSLGYAVFLATMAGCAVALLRNASKAAVRVPGADSARAGLTWRTRLLWVALALVPSSAMLGATLELTTDVAAIPLLWILPLALYLLTFVVAFSTRLVTASRHSGYVLAVLCVAVAVISWIGARPSPALAIPLHLAALTAVGLVCHGRLAASRPVPERLTEFYLWIGFGGMLGGLFNAVVAPRLFDSVVEYPLALVLACWLRAPGSRERRALSRQRGILVDVALICLVLLFMAGLHAFLSHEISAEETRLRIEAPIAGLICLGLVRRRVRFGVALGMLFLAAASLGGTAGTTLHAERTFFGVLRVKVREGSPYKMPGSADPDTVHRIASHDLYHGTTRHNRQMLDPELRRVPATYYHPSGPIGQVFLALRDAGRSDDVGLVGLGAGSLAAYARAGQRFTFYEIDPAMTRIARDPRWFTYLQDSRGEVRIADGDGRLLLSQEPDGRFGLIVIDGFSSDAIPVHLLTREALELYVRKLSDRGLLALHLTSEHFDLLPVVQALAADLHLSGAHWWDEELSDWHKISGKSASHWAVLARDAAALSPLREHGAWEPLEASGAERRFLWTDDFSSPLLVLR
jgi:hypothetical protein